MHRLALHVKQWILSLRRGAGDRSARPAARTRPQLEPLEDRCVPANASGNITGATFIDANGNGRRDVGEPAVVGAEVNLIGRTLQGKEVDVTASTRSNGSYNFLNVQPGRYRLQADPPNGVLGGAARTSFFFVGPGKNVHTNLSFAGLATQSVSLRQFLNSTTSSAFPFGGSNPGVGTAKASSRPNNRPTILDAIGPVTEDVNSSDTVIDLAGVFSDPDMANSRIRFVTSAGNIDLELFDKLAPKTVANFFNYITSDAYDNTIFHRLGAFLHSPSTTRDVLQGGLFKFDNEGGDGSLTTIVDEDTPKVEDEVGRPNVKGTISMAKTNDTNSATSQFFFNLIDNVQPLSDPPQTNGGFTVFGRIDPASQSVIDELAGFNVQNKSSFNGNLQNLPLRAGAGAGTEFPANTEASDYALIRDVKVLKRPERLTYKVVGNSNETLVNASIVNNRLVLNYAQDQSGTARITIKATDKFGATTKTSFTVTVNP